MLVQRPIPQAPTGVVLGACRHGAEADTAPPEEVGEAEAPVAPKEALVESVLAPVDAPEVEQTGGGATEASPVDAAMAQTSELELPASSTICNNPKIHTPKITTTKFLLLSHAMLSDICRSQP